MAKPKIEVKRMGKRWWIVGDPDTGPWGPYESKTEAEDIRRGVNRFYRHENDPEFFTSKRELL